MSATGNRLDDWTWSKDRFEQIFGQRLPGGFRENWPSGKRVAALLTFDTQGDVDATVPGFENKWVGYEDRINYCDVTMRQYDVLEGVPRILRILDKYGVKATFPTCGLTCEWYPDLIKEIAAGGHEVAVHGFHHVPLLQLDPDGERAEIERATEAVAAVIGEQPKGWRCPLYSITEHTLDFLRDFGYVWDSDFHDQDFPYVLSKDGRTIVEIPAGHDDWTLYLMLGPGTIQMGGTPYGTADGVLGTMKAEFDILYEESADEPRVFQFCMHPKITGRPFRAAVLDRLIAYLQEHDGMWFPTCAELAALA
jgi:peptidoglycan/xylan/chitin deacetylase (PgdA/CDA1 family)